jgi:hypothetical protein
MTEGNLVATASGANRSSGRRATAPPWRDTTHRRMRARRVRRGVVALVAALTTGSAVLLAGPAAAAEPMRLTDTTDSVHVEAVNADRALAISVERSVVAGTYVTATLYGGPAGDHLGDGVGTSEWTDDTFRATAELLDGAGNGIGTVQVTGRYVVVGDTQTEAHKFNDGNIRVIMEHSRTSLAVTDVSVSLDGVAFDVEGTMGRHETGYLFVSQPATYVGSFGYAVISEPVTENVADFSTDTAHGLDSVGIDLQYADSPLMAAGGVNLTKRTWSGTFGLRTEEGEQVGRVAAASTLTAKGQTLRFFERENGGFEGWSATPYELTVAVDGPVSPAKITAQVLIIRYSWHTSPLGEAAG